MTWTEALAAIRLGARVTARLCQGSVVHVTPSTLAGRLSVEWTDPVGHVETHPQVEEWFFVSAGAEWSRCDHATT